MQAWWHLPVMTLGTLRQEDHEFNTSLGYTVRPTLKKKKSRTKIICSPSYVDTRSRANTTRGLDFEHMIKMRAHKGGVRIGKTPKKLDSICCP
jgi:hypothetical protein